MAIRANKNWAVIEYVEPDAYRDFNGIYVPSEATKRGYIRRQSHKILVSGDYLPDVIRVGTYTTGDCEGIAEGAYVLFNKNDAVEFKLEEKTYFAIPSKFVIGVLSPDPK